ncbi:MAG TPA: cobalamin-binding protein [Anaerolinea thermolimosa]|uniref:Cobalamin-binding protein n=1 Tax=Anaerolinea thermolimosa TaxID=229919 RepID=A0A3D1JFK1_9CHLR|nr:corrinoid protein [Anaerolinea thermolimosa]GAP08417.1 predicted cobalamin binding protein [Anaerolinea thermolimosa]HCE17359.1 cobalamin-binding protein [Anaerolinea thermolimosa]
MDEKLKAIYQCIVEGDNNGVQEHVRAALESGMDAGTILNEGLIAGMAEVGRLFEEGEYFVPEMLISARAMKSAMAILKPHLTSEQVGFAGRVAIGTVKGDLHDIGKNLVGLMLEGAGFQVIDLGSDVAPEKFVEAAKNNDVDIVAMSALLTTTMVNMKSTIAALEEAGVREKVKVMIGGAPVTEAYARQIGADGYAPDASRAVALAKSLLS